MVREGGAKDMMLRMLGLNQFDGNQAAMPIFEDFKRTGDARFFPPAVQPEVNGHKLSSEHAIELEMLVGQARLNKIEPLVNGMATIKVREGDDLVDKKYEDLSDDKRIKRLKDLYESGVESGKRLFLKLHPEYSEKSK